MPFLQNLLLFLLDDLLESFDFSLTFAAQFFELLFGLLFVFIQLLVEGLDKLAVRFRRDSKLIFNLIVEESLMVVLAKGVPNRLRVFLDNGQLVDD